MNTEKNPINIHFFTVAKSSHNFFSKSWFIYLTTLSLIIYITDKQKQFRFHSLHASACEKPCNKLNHYLANIKSYTFESEAGTKIQLTFNELLPSITLQPGRKGCFFFYYFSTFSLILFPRCRVSAAAWALKLTANHKLHHPLPDVSAWIMGKSYFETL